MTATMIGVGEVMTPRGRMPAEQGLALAGLQPLVLAPKEGLALLNGTQFSTAVALAALFEAEVVFSDRPSSWCIDDRCLSGRRHTVRPAHPRASQAPGSDRGSRRAQ